ncbi:MAG: rane protein [Frankiaceae bacterium]|jgi:membrane protein|nr:rane protein [Frankiaceae bacterium]
MPSLSTRRRPGGVIAAARRRPWFDHLVQAAGRYRRDNGDRLAASITYYAFLSFFPLLLLGTSVLAFLVNRDPAMRQRVLASLGDYLPGVNKGIQDNLTTVVNRRRTVGVVGVLGLIWAGLGWLDALRDALRTMWHHDTNMGNIARKKLVDVVTLIGLGATIGLSLLVTGVFSASASWALRRAGVSGKSPIGVGATAVVAFVLGVVADTALFGYYFTRLPKFGHPFRHVARGAVFGAVGFGGLKLAGRFYVTRFVATAGRAFGAFAVVAGLLIWINLVARFTLYAAAWTVTGPYDDDVLPSGTSSARASHAAGLSPAQAEAIQDDGVPAGTLLTKEALTGDPDA